MLFFYIKKGFSKVVDVRQTLKVCYNKDTHTARVLNILSVPTEKFILFEKG